MSSDAKLKAYIDRILRCREAEDLAKEDTKAVYAELAGDGYEKAIVGQVVTFLRKREKDGDKVAEQSAKFDLYLEAYERPSHAHTREERSDGGLNILTKHEDIRTAPATATEFQAKASDDNGATEQDLEDTADSVTGDASRSSRGDDSPATIPQSDDGAIAAVNGKAGLANADGVEPPPSDRPADQPLAGGDHEEVADSRAVMGEGDASAALPAAGVVMEYVPPTGMTRLPFAHCFPELSKAEYERLEKDIAANRVREPIIRQGDVIVDGWARYNISRAYGMSYPVLELHPSRDVLLSIIKWQRAARNFTPGQERKIAAELAKEFPSRADDIMAAFGLAEALEAAE